MHYSPGIQQYYSQRFVKGRRFWPVDSYIARLHCRYVGHTRLVTPPSAGQKALEYIKAIKMVLLK